MKKAIFLGVSIGIIILLLTLIPTSKTYGLTTVVVDVSKANDKVTCQDCNGNLWQFEGVEDWCVNDIATFIMDDMGTEEINDDEIVSVRYNGWFEDWLENTEETIFFEEDSLQSSRAGAGQS